MKQFGFFFPPKSLLFAELRQIEFATFSVIAISEKSANSIFHKNNVEKYK